MIQGCEPVPIRADNESGRKYELGKAISQVRRDMKLTQGDFAQMLNEDLQSIQDYESGEALPTKQMLSRLEKVLRVELRGTRLQKLMPSGEELGAFMGALVNLTAYTVTRGNRDVGFIAEGAAATLMGLIVGKVFNNAVTKILMAKKGDAKWTKAFTSLQWVAVGGLLPIIIGGFIPSWPARAIVTGLGMLLLKLFIAICLVRRYNIGMSNGVLFVLIGVLGIAIGAGFAELVHVIGKPQP